MAASYEEACALAATMVTTERFQTLGVPETMRIYGDRLVELGWTTRTLCEEAKRRMHTRIEELRAAERPIETLSNDELMARIATFGE